ncbi:hypothetical protein STH2276 [Symbiobacterium thermophilum IAM 14863]|uniref:Uncharacterized protein n=1 Tax=Symbiobacterium thermophilum (strain DSM 24528 / JCM 14929 / IAM 14863 / T) TaxID=292459 RepID=Q67M34_SYMTH|nr:hypothetical protein STH2276 [Symbiobacterium thermophilum IAM 14863]
MPLLLRRNVGIDSPLQEPLNVLLTEVPCIGRNLLRHLIDIGFDLLHHGDQVRSICRLVCYGSSDDNLRIGIDDGLGVVPLDELLIRAFHDPGIGIRKVALRCWCGFCLRPLPPTTALGPLGSRLLGRLMFVSAGPQAHFGFQSSLGFLNLGQPPLTEAEFFGQFIPTTMWAEAVILGLVSLLGFLEQLCDLRLQALFFLHHPAVSSSPCAWRRWP